MTKPVKRPQQRKGIQLSRRSLDYSPATFNDDAQSVDIIITTTSPVLTCIPDPTWTGAVEQWPVIEAYEILLPDGLDYSRTPRMPLVDGHDTESGEAKVLGRVDNVRAEGDAIVGTAFFRPTRSDIYQDVKAGFLGQVSAGYSVSEYELVEPEDGSTIPTALATKWTLLEASLVAVAADAAASVRSQNPIQSPVFKKRSAKHKDAIMAFFKRGKRSKRDDDTQDDTDIASAVDEAVAALSAVVDAVDDSDDADDETVERARKLRKMLRDLDGSDADQDDDDQSRKRGKRDDDDSDDADRADDDEDDSDDKDVRSARAIARSYGKNKLKLVNDMRKLGATGKEIQKALRRSLGQSPAEVQQDVEPQRQRNNGQASVPNTSKIYERANSVFKSR